MTAISAITAAGIAVLAIVLLGHNRATTALPRAAPAAGRAAVADCLSHGKLTRGYSVAELRSALATMPDAIEEYTNCYEVINRARQIQVDGPARVAPSLTRHFALFRSKPGHPASLAATFLVHPTPSVLVSRFGLDTSQAHTVQLTSSFAVRIYPGTSGACMNWRNADGISGTWACDLVANVDEGSLIGQVALKPHGADHEVFGLVPDGDATVVIEEAAGTNQTVAVRDNMFLANIGSGGDWTLKVGSPRRAVHAWHGVIKPRG